MGVGLLLKVKLIKCHINIYILLKKSKYAELHKKTAVNLRRAGTQDLGHTYALVTKDIQEMEKRVKV